MIALPREIRVPVAAALTFLSLACAGMRSKAIAEEIDAEPADPDTTELVVAAADSTVNLEEIKLPSGDVFRIATAPESRVAAADSTAVPTSTEKAEPKPGLFTWLGIGAGLAVSATLSGLNLGLFRVSRLRLNVMADQGDKDAQRLLELRQDSNTLLATMVWAGVATGVAVSQLAGSAMAGVAGFLISAVGLTLLGDLIPQAYFSKNALKLGSAFAPVVRALRVALYPIAKPCGWLLDKTVGPDLIEYFRNEELKTLIDMHTRSPQGGPTVVEARGSINMLGLDGIKVTEEGEPIDPRSILMLPYEDGRIVLPNYAADHRDPFLSRLHESGMRWVVFCSPDGTPQMVLDADSFLRDVFCDRDNVQYPHYWHRPIVVTDPEATLGGAAAKLTVHPEHDQDDVVDNDVILVWTANNKRIITGADLFGRVFRGITRVAGGREVT